MRTLFSGARLGTCLRHALLKLPQKLVAIDSPLPKDMVKNNFPDCLSRSILATE
jgi:hypothetical protein